MLKAGVYMSSALLQVSKCASVRELVMWWAGMAAVWWDGGSGRAGASAAAAGLRRSARECISADEHVC